MRQNNYLRYLMVQVLVIVSVLGIFRFVENRQIAATVAGFLFVLLPLGMIFLELKAQKSPHILWLIVVLQFWVFFALPILGVRLMNWGIPFDQLSVFSIPGPLLHQWSSKSYVLMMAGTAWAWWKAPSEDIN